MKNIVLAVVFVLCLAGFSQASVIYDFSGTYTDFFTGNVVGPVHFTLTLPSPVPYTGNLINPDATYFPGAQLTCDACFYISFYYDAVARGFTSTPSNVVGYGVSSAEYFFYFDPASFTVDGNYHDVFGSFPNSGDMTVSGIGSPVPEPASLVLLGTGLVGLAGAARRKLMP